MPAKKNKTAYEHLRSLWIAKHKGLQQSLWEKHHGALRYAANNTQQIAVGSLSALLLLAAPHPQLALPESPPLLTMEANPAADVIDKNSMVLLELSGKLPKEVRELTREEEKNIEEMLSNLYGLPISAELDGKRLNRSYGYIGAEQHLARYPGDTMASHFDSQEDADKYTSSGMAPGLGAWGYFAPSYADFTEKDKEREKYYIAVQTFLAPDFNNRVAEYRDFFRFRKMILVNPNNGKAMVTVIGDAGPGPSTGKHLGGSPEVMKYLERFDGRQKGPVLYFFIDDPEDKIPLGPIDIQSKYSSNV